MKIVIICVLIIGVCRCEPENIENCSFELPLSRDMLREKFECAMTKFKASFRPIDFAYQIKGLEIKGEQCHAIENVTSVSDFINNCYCFLNQHKYPIFQAVDILSEIVYGANPHFSTIFGLNENGLNTSMMIPPSANQQTINFNQTCPKCEINFTPNITQICPKSDCNCVRNTTQIGPKSECHFMPNVSLSCPPLDCSKCDRGMGKKI